MTTTPTKNESLPEPMTASMCPSPDYAKGWNDCLTALTREAPTEGDGEDITLCPQHGHMYARRCAHCAGDIDALSATPPAPQRMAQGEDNFVSRWTKAIREMPMGSQPPHQDRGEVDGHVAMLRSLRLMYADGVMEADDHPGTLSAIDAAIAALTEAKQQGPGEAVAYAVYGSAEEYGPVMLPDYVGSMEVIRNRVMAGALREGFKGNFVERMAALGWWLEPLFLAAAPQVEAKRQTGEDQLPKFAVGDRVIWTNKFGTSFLGVIEECWSGPVRYCVALDDGTIAGVAYESEIAAAAKPSGES